MSAIQIHLASAKARVTRAGGPAPIERTLLALAVLLSVIVVGLVIARAFGHRKVAGIVEGYQAISGKPAASQPAGASAAATPAASPPTPAPTPNPPAKPNPVIAARLQRINDRKLLAPPQASIQLSGILGDEAIFNGGQAVKVGGTILNGTVTKINADSVELLVDGQPTTLYVFGPSPVGSGGGPSGGSPRGGGMPGGPRAEGPRRGGRGGMSVEDLTPERIAQFKQMPPAVRERVLKDMEQQNPEVAQKLRQAL